MLAGATFFALAGAGAASADNTGCGVSGSVADCPEVPSDGVRYTTAVKTINITGDSGGTTTVESGVEGIYLTESGGSGSTSTTPNYDLSKKVHLNLVPDEDNTPDTWVLANSADQPILSGGNYIVVVGDGTYSINSVVYPSADALTKHLTASNTSGGTVSGSLTINNPKPFPGPVGGIVTTNADGILIRSTGGNGGNGGCSTVLVYTWCSNGKTGGSAGSVVVNSNGAITVNGSSEKQYGISAVSQGGNGGDGGGSFGLFASDAGAGGVGGAGGAVEVFLGQDSSIITHGKYGHGVYAVSRGGKGGGGGTPYGAYAGGDEGGRGGNAGSVVVENHGSILTTGEGGLWHQRDQRRWPGRRRERRLRHRRRWRPRRRIVSRQPRHRDQQRFRGDPKQQLNRDIRPVGWRRRR